MLKIFLWLRYLRKRRVVLLSIAAIGLALLVMGIFFYFPATQVWVP